MEFGDCVKFRKQLNNKYSVLHILISNSYFIFHTSNMLHNSLLKRFELSCIQPCVLSSVEFVFYQHRTPQPNSDSFCLIFRNENNFDWSASERYLRVILDIIVHSVRQVEMICIHQILADFCNKKIHAD